MMKKNLVLVAAALFAVGTAWGAGERKPMEIVKASQQSFSVPTLKIRNLSGDPETVNALKSFLKSCGWFRVVDSGEGDYTLDGVAGSGDIRLNLSFGGNVVLNRTFNFKGNPRRAAARAVDAILEERFEGRPRLCDSRIAFCAELVPNVKAIVVCDIDGGNVIKATNYSTSCVEPGWMPDGNSIVYTRYYSSGTDVCQTVLSPWKTRRLTSFPGMNVGVTVHPSGSFLALVMSVDRQVELYVKGFNSRDRRRLTTSKAVEASPSWSPDGGRICYVSDQTGRPALFVIGANGGAEVKLPTVGTEAVTPDWSKDNKIVYSAKLGGEYKLAVYDMNHTESGVIPNLAGGSWESPSWAPDNRHVVASRRNGRRSELYVVDTKTGNSRRLVHIDAPMSSPAWSNLR